MSNGLARMPGNAVAQTSPRTGHCPGFECRLHAPAPPRVLGLQLACSQAQRIANYNARHATGCNVLAFLVGGAHTA